MAGRKPRADAIPLMFQWRWHATGIRRVWRTDWSGDVFEILDAAEFVQFEAWARRFSFRVVEADDD